MIQVKLKTLCIFMFLSSIFYFMNGDFFVPASEFPAPLPFLLSFLKKLNFQSER